MSLFELLGNTQRLKIIRELTDGPMYVSELADAVGMNGKTASHHLSVLEETGLLDYYYQGNRKYFRLVGSVQLEASPAPERSFVLQVNEQPLSSVSD